MKFAVKNPLKRRVTGARTKRTESEKKVWPPKRASAELDCEWRFTTRQPLESLPSAKMKESPPRQYGRSCTHEGGLSRMRLCRWPDSYNGRTLRTRRNGTTRR